MIKSQCKTKYISGPTKHNMRPQNATILKLKTIRTNFFKIKITYISSRH